MAYERTLPLYSYTRPKFFHLVTGFSCLEQTSSSAMEYNCPLSGNLLSIPFTFLDPITRRLLKDPVITVDGQCYENRTIEAWFAQGHRTSPLTMLPLYSTTLIPNSDLKQAINNFFKHSRKPASKAEELKQHATDGKPSTLIHVGCS